MNKDEQVLHASKFLQFVILIYRGQSQLVRVHIALFRFICAKTFCKRGNITFKQEDILKKDDAELLLIKNRLIYVTK